MEKASALKYSKPSQLLHWVTAVLVFWMGIFGVLMFLASSRSDQGFFLRFHLIGGLLLVGIHLIRLAWRWFDSAPPPPERLSPLNRLLFKATHWAIYAVLSVLLISGIGMLFAFTPALLPFSISPFLSAHRSLLFFSHLFLFVALFGLVAGHVGGVLYYQVRKGDVLSRMGIRWFVNR